MRQRIVRRPELMELEPQGSGGAPSADPRNASGSTSITCWGAAARKLGTTRRHTGYRACQAGLWGTLGGWACARQRSLGSGSFLFILLDVQIPRWCHGRKQVDVCGEPTNERAPHLTKSLGVRVHLIDRCPCSRAGETLDKSRLRLRRRNADRFNSVVIRDGSWVELGHGCKLHTMAVDFYLIPVPDGENNNK